MAVGADPPAWVAASSEPAIAWAAQRGLTIMMDPHSPHVEIARPAFEVALDVFQHSRLITKRHRYEDVCAAPPEGV